MTNSARMLARVYRRLTQSPRSALLALGLVVGLATPLLAASPAAAIVTEVTGASVGLQPRNGTSYITNGDEVLEKGSVVEHAGAGTFANEAGNAVLHGTETYAVYWDPDNLFHHEWVKNIDKYFERMGAASGELAVTFADIGQFRDRSNVPAVYKTVFRGSYSDTAKYPTAGCTDPNRLEVGAVTCLTDAQLRAQVESFIASQGTPKGMKSVYYIMTPPGVTVCLDAAATHCSDYKVSKEEEEKEERKSTSYKDSFCSYHADIDPDNAIEGDASTILYAAIPWSAGTLGDSSAATGSLYAQSFDCQDGGWNPEGNEENREVPRERDEAEQNEFEAANKQEKATLETAKRLGGPHQEEPNQEGKGEFGDYGAGLSDLIVNQISEEQADTVTDPLLNAWQDSEHREVTDECRNVFAGTAGGSGIEGSVTAEEHTSAGSLYNQVYNEVNSQLPYSEEHRYDEEAEGAGDYYTNNVFNLSGGDCVGGVGLVPRFSNPNPVSANEPVSFDGMESTVSLLEGEGFGPSGPPSKTYATFTWNFGDGTPNVTGYAPGAPLCEAPWLSPCAASIFHSYKYGGKYQVTLTVTDVAGNVANVSRMLNVAGPPAPAAVAPPTSVPDSNTSAAGAAIVTPVASASILSRSLRSVVLKGLLIRYSVNEQVAGHFEVLISRAAARKLKLGGAPATGLPAGTPPELVIAKAVLVTTKGGRSTMAIKFSKAVIARLKHAHKASLMVRLTVRDAASKSPATSTVLSSVNLAG